MMKVYPEDRAALLAITERVEINNSLKRAKKLARKLPPISREQKAFEERKLPDPPELPVMPSPPTAPERYVSEDDARTKRLIAFLAEAKPFGKPEQLRLL